MNHILKAKTGLDAYMWRGGDFVVDGRTTAAIARDRLRVILPMDRMRTGHPQWARPGSVFYAPGDWRIGLHGGLERVIE